MTTTQAARLSEMAPDAIVDLIQASARCYLGGLRRDPTTGADAYGDLAEAIDAREYGPFAVLGAWRLIQGTPSTLADICQVKDELHVGRHVLAPFAHAGGYSLTDLTDWSREIGHAVWEHPDDLSIAARICANVSARLAAGAQELQRQTGSPEVGTWVELFSRRAAAFATEPNEDGAYLDDDLLLFDQR